MNIQLTRAEWQRHLWGSFRALQERKTREAAIAGFVTEELQIEEANRRINEMSNIELIDALT